MAHDLTRSGESKVRKVRKVNFTRKRGRRRVFSKEFREWSHLGWARQGGRCQTVKPILFSISSEGRGFRMKDVVRPFRVLEDVLRIFLDGLRRMDDGLMEGTVFSIFASQRHENVAVFRGMLTVETVVPV